VLHSIWSNFHYYTIRTVNYITWRNLPWIVECPHYSTWYVQRLPLQYNFKHNLLENRTFFSIFCLCFTGMFTFKSNMVPMITCALMSRLEDYLWLTIHLISQPFAPFCFSRIKDWFSACCFVWQIRSDSQFHVFFLVYRLMVVIYLWSLILFYWQM